MALLKNLIERIMYNTYDFCCLCLKSLERNEIFNNITDEVILDNNITQDMFYILSHIVQDTVFHNIVDTFGFICQHCTEAALRSYKFIRKCQGNVLKLFNIVKSLNNYFENNQYGGDGKKIYVHSDIKIDIKLENHSKSENSSEIQLSNECISNNPLCDQTKCLVEYESQKNEISSIETPVKKESNVKSCSESRNDKIRDETDPSVFKCKICKNIYSRGPNLKKHYLSVHAPKIYKCSLCHEGFGSALLLKTHEKSRHTQGTAVCCIECGKVYNSMYALQNHERRHKTRLVCQHCGKVYKTKQSFKSHIDSNHGEQPKKVKPKFICDHCGKTYSQKSGLRLHIGFEHGQGKYYECEWCKKRLSSLSHLKEHIITHTKDKPFSCKLCGGRFSTKMSLLYHTRRHTGERPYQCNHCDSSFISASRRLGHIKQHHLPPELQCDICLKEFKLKNCLRKHRLKHFNCKSSLQKAQ